MRALVIHKSAALASRIVTVGLVTFIGTLACVSALVPIEVAPLKSSVFTTIFATLKWAISCVKPLVLGFQLATIEGYRAVLVDFFKFKVLLANAFALF